MRFKSLAGGLTGLALLSALLPQAARASSADLVFVLNSGEANIQLLDGRSHEEIRRIPVLREVHHLTLTPDRSQILVGDSGGAPETVTRSSGLVLPDDPCAWSAALAALLADPARRAAMGAAGSDHVRDHFGTAAARRTLRTALDLPLE